MKCQEAEVHLDKVHKVEKQMWSSETIQECSQLLKILSDPTRLKIVIALANEPLCVCDLEAILCMSQSAISHQLRSLKEYNIVMYERKGKKIEYRLVDKHIYSLLQLVKEHSEENNHE